MPACFWSASGKRTRTVRTKLCLLLKISGVEVTPSVTSVESSEQFWSKIRQIWSICEPWTNDENLSFDFLSLYKPSTSFSSMKLVNVKDSSSPIVSQLYEQSKWQQNNDQEQTSQYGRKSLGVFLTFPLFIWMAFDISYDVIYQNLY